MTSHQPERAGVDAEDVVVIETRADDTDVSTGGASGAAGGGTERWSEIKALFVDEPGESVQAASEMVDRAIENLMSALRQRQESMASWEADGSADTEELRNALRDYQRLFDQLDQMSRQLSGRKVRSVQPGPAPGQQPST
jgi:hypothetical protein